MTYFLLVAFELVIMSVVIADTYIADYLEDEPGSYAIICQKTIKTAQWHFFRLGLSSQGCLDSNYQENQTSNVHPVWRDPTNWCSHTFYILQLKYFWVSLGSVLQILVLICVCHHINHLRFQIDFMFFIATIQHVKVALTKSWYVPCCYI